MTEPVSVRSRSSDFSPVFPQITMVLNLPVFGVDPAEFAHRCQVGVAASTSVGEAPNRPPGTSQVMVQGNQIRFIGKLLQGRRSVSWGSGCMFTGGGRGCSWLQYCSWCLSCVCLPLLACSVRYCRCAGCGVLLEIRMLFRKAWPE